jgi:hypothetical protein
LFHRRIKDCGRPFDASSVTERAYEEPEDWNTESVNDIKRPQLVQVCIAGESGDAAPNHENGQIRQKQEFEFRRQPAFCESIIKQPFFARNSLVRQFKTSENFNVCDHLLMIFPQISLVF